MKRLSLILLLGATMCLTGCFTTESVPLRDGSTHVVMRNSGWKFFNVIPLFSGNASSNRGGVAFFRNDVTLDKIQARFDALANGREVLCPVYDVNDQLFISVLGIPVPYILTYREISLSGSITK